MAYEVPGQIVSFPTTSTGLAQYRFVNLSTSGNLIYTTNGAPAIGVLQAGSTGSTTAPAALPVMIAGISKVAVAAASTVGVGQVVTATSVGSIEGASAGDYVVGRVVAGTSGGANRVLSVQVAGPNYSTGLA